MTPVRVLDLRDTYEVGGPGKTILETFRAADRGRVDLHLGVFLRRGESADTPFLRAARDYGMPVHLISGFHQYDPRLVSRTAALIRAHGFDIVHAHEVKSDVITYLASRLQRCRTVTTLHGWIGNSARQRAFIALDRQVIRRFDLVLAVSERIRDEAIAAGVPAGRVRLVHNAIVLDAYRRTGTRGFLRELAGGEVPRPVIACIGRLSAEKGQADLIEALALVAGRGRRVSAVLAGDGPERARLERQAAGLGLNGSVVFPGYVDRPQRLLEETDLLVLPSHTEGLPNAALEALAMHVPVLATRVGGTPEVIVDGETGRLVPPGAPAVLADAIEHFLDHRDEWTQMASRGRDRVAARFDFDARTRTVEKLYTDLAGGSRP